MKFFFLLYFARSGSTFFANSVWQGAARTVVMPELRFVELLAKVGDRRLATSSSADVKHLLLSDPRSTKLELLDLESIIAEYKHLGVRGLVEAICYGYAASLGLQGKPELVVVKSGTALWMFHKIIRYFPDAGVLHISRDPRGALASLWHTPAAFRNRRSMTARGPVSLSRSWICYERRVRALADRQKNVISIRYEELCRNHDQVLAGVLQQLNTRRDKISPATTIMLHPAEQCIHGNVGKPPLNERCFAWREELHPWQGFVIESITQQHLDQLYFTPQVPRLQRALARTVYYTLNVLEFVYRSGRFMLRKIAAIGTANCQQIRVQAKRDTDDSCPHQSPLRSHRQSLRI